AGPAPAGNCGAHAGDEPVRYHNGVESRSNAFLWLLNKTSRHAGRKVKRSHRGSPWAWKFAKQSSVPCHSYLDDGQRRLQQRRVPALSPSTMCPKFRWPILESRMKALQPPRAEKDFHQDSLPGEGGRHSEARMTPG